METGLVGGIPNRQNHRRPRPQWESVPVPVSGDLSSACPPRMAPSCLCILRDVESTGRQAPLQELSNELAALLLTEDPWLHLPVDSQLPHYLISYT